MPSIHYKPAAPVLNRRLAREWGLVLATPFCESSGTVTKELVQGQNFTLSGDATLDRQSLPFSGGDDFLDFGSHYNHLLLGALTILVHYTVAQNTAEGAIAAKHQTASNIKRGIQFGQNNVGKLGLLVSPTGTEIGQNFINANTTLTIGSTITAAGVFLPSRFMRVYLNGKLDGQLTSFVPNQIFDSDRTWRIGARDGGTGNPVATFEGKLHSLAICNTALSPRQIEQYHDDPLLFYRADTPQVMYSYPTRPKLVLKRFV
jgi:hypothetical protein